MRFTDREVDGTRRGCFGSCGAVGCVLLLAAIFLPVSTCFAGSKMRGYEAAIALVAMLFRGALPAILPIYATTAAAVSGIVLMNSRVSRGLMLTVLPAPIAAFMSLSTPLQVGWVVWFVAVTMLTLGVGLMYGWGHPR